MTQQSSSHHSLTTMILENKATTAFALLGLTAMFTIVVSTIPDTIQAHQNMLEQPPFNQGLLEQSHETPPTPSSLD